MPRGILYVSEILAWADEHRERTGKFPTADAGIVRGHPDEKWQNIDQALRNGGRGLRRGWSLPRLLAERRGHRNRKNLPKYSITTILHWADAHKRRTGSWPTLGSGVVHSAPGETWTGVNTALRNGIRGLPGGSSIARVLANHRGVRNRASIPDLTISRILRWADEHKRQTGHWPTIGSGRIADTPGETWAAVNRALQRETRGLTGGSSLFQLLARRRGIRHHPRLSPLSVTTILEWADAYKQRTGRWPNDRSGKIPEAPPETWSRVIVAIYKGKRGLPRGWSLARLLAKWRGYRNPLGLPKYSLTKILRWADAHKRHTGSWPTRDSGPIRGAPGETWSAVNTALRNGIRGLPGGSSLQMLLAKHRGLRTRASNPKLSTLQVLRWADHHKARTGSWPAVQTGPIAEAHRETWRGVDHALRRGTRGLPGGSSLFALLAEQREMHKHCRRSSLSVPQILKWADAHKRRTGRWPNRHSGRIPGTPGETWDRVCRALDDEKRGLIGASSLMKLLSNHRGVRNIHDLPQLTEKLILKWARAWRRQHGRTPVVKSGSIPQTDGEKWLNVDASLRLGLRGLTGGLSLAKLIRTRSKERSVS